LRLDQEKGNNEIGVNISNYVRCVSGSFHNLAGTLYQAGRHGAAIGFLVNGCNLGQEALSLHVAELLKDSNSNGSRESNAADRRETDGWKQLEEQLYRRWELLGVCYVKIGDRKVRMRLWGRLSLI
jgi:separase